VAPKKPPSIMLQLLKTFGLRMLIVALLKTLQDFLRFVPPQVLKRLIRFISNRYNDLNTYTLLLAIRNVKAQRILTFLTTGRTC
jgi:hypothetical protein